MSSDQLDFTHSNTSNGPNDRRTPRFEDQYILLNTLEYVDANRLIHHGKQQTDWRCQVDVAHLDPPVSEAKRKMTLPTSPMLLLTLRRYSQRASPSRVGKLGTVAVMGYCCIAFSAPFAGAAVMSQRAATDKRYINMYGKSTNR